MISIPDIKTSISNGLILDGFIKNGNFETDSRGRLKMFAGGFTVVFPTIVNGEKWGFRCWHNDLGNLRSHFEILSEELDKLNCPYFCDFVYEDEGEFIPVEVKAADNTQAKSYKQFCKKYNPKRGVKLSEKNIAQNLCESTDTYSIPLYLGWNLDYYIFQKKMADGSQSIF